jgi:hypothetical protein
MGGTRDHQAEQDKPSLEKNMASVFASVESRPKKH